MIQLHVVSGGAAGKRLEESRFPIAVGRAGDCALQLSDPGVFDRHFEIRFSPEGFSLGPAPNAVTTVNGSRTEGSLLRNGDLIGAGYAKIQFWLGSLQQRGLRVRESLAWLMIIGVIAAQIILLSQLLALGGL